MSFVKAGRTQKMRYIKVIVNIPLPLISRFDKICEREGFSRQEAIKQAMREFVYEHTDENDIEPEQMKEFWKTMIAGMAEAAKEFPPQNTNQIELKKS